MSAFTFKYDHEQKASFWNLEFLLSTFFTALSAQLLSTLACFSLSSLRRAIKAATLYFLLQAAVGIKRAPVSNCEPSLKICDPEVHSRDLNLDLPITLKIRQTMLQLCWLFFFLFICTSCSSLNVKRN